NMPPVGNFNVDISIIPLISCTDHAPLKILFLLLCITNYIQQKKTTIAFNATAVFSVNHERFFASFFIYSNFPKGWLVLASRTAM
ncbi:hypothetical protein DKZ31_06545, partial [Limosilactobacillus reuteri]|uniref:hypothetical protein n=1 Tax=Limosilactobacillus reuteri TaxID=1598 RepID=UPI000D9C9229